MPIEPHELMNSVIDAKPVDFDKQFSSLVQDRIAAIVDDKKIEVAKNFFASPEATVEVDDEEESVSDDLVQDSGDENDNTQNMQEPEDDQE